MCEQCRYEKIDVVREIVRDARTDQIERLLRAVLMRRGASGEEGRA